MAAHFAGAAAQEAVLAASGLAECVWWTEWSGSVPPWGSNKFKPHLERGRQHYRQCGVCQTRASYVAQNCPPVPEFPVPWTYRVIRRVTRWVGERVRAFRRQSDRVAE